MCTFHPFLCSAYTEAFKVCSVAAGPLTGSVGDAVGEVAGEEDQGRTSEEEDAGADSNYDKQVSFYKICKKINLMFKLF